MVFADMLFVETLRLSNYSYDPKSAMMRGGGGVFLSNNML